MREGGKGGANTRTGQEFEDSVDLISFILMHEDYEVRDMLRGAGQGIYFKGNLVARCFEKYKFYEFLRERGVDWKEKISKRLVPDNAFVVIVRETLFILEVKFQKGSGSVDEKLQTCDFKRKQYLKLVNPLGLRVEYVYILNEWFRKPAYKDVLDYIHSVNCHYTFNRFPLAWYGLPDSNRL
ncbi:MAG: hypothetical protein OXH77_04685 [Anaerolineaceae bacterium]|nr:hypothetical protein [Anaerolineaceae bacterium]